MSDKNEDLAFLIRTGQITEEKAAAKATNTKDEE